MKQKSVLGLMVTAAAAIAIWACNDSTSAEPDEPVSISSSVEDEDSSSSTEKSTKAKSSSSTEKSSSSKKAKSSSSTEKSSSSKKAKSSSSTEKSSSSGKAKSSSSTEKSSSSEKAKSSSSAEKSSSSGKAKSSSSTEKSSSSEKAKSSSSAEKTSSSSKVEPSSSSEKLSSSSKLESSSSAAKSSSSSKVESSSSAPKPSSSSKIEPSSSSEKLSSSSKPESSSSIEISSSSEPSSSSEVLSSSSEEEISVCDGKAYRSGNHNLSVTVDGKKRTFIMHVPSAYKGDKPVPLVVDYHPIMGSGSNQLNGTTYKALTDPEGVISLYPDGTKSADSRKMGPGWNVGPCCSDDDDVKFTREMITAVEEKVCIDKKRVYATGFSMGGGMTNHVACNLADVFAAVAPAGMDLNKTNSARCNPERPISIIMFRGTADNVCRYQGGDSGYNDGLNFLGAEGNFRFWAEKNGCVGTPTKNSDGCQEYSNCQDGTKVVLCTKQNGGHEQGDGRIGWPFLKQFTLP